MSGQISHEAEYSRQHARYNIPVKIIIDKKTYYIDNWSVSGLAIKNAPIILGQKKSFKADLLFDFQKIQSILSIELERKDYRVDESTLRCSFINLDYEKLSFMHHIINTYLSGEIVSSNSAINVLQNSRFTKRNLSKNIDEEMSWDKKMLHRLRQTFISIVLTSIVLGLLGFISYNIYNKFYVVKSTNAIISADTVVIRAPAPGYYIPADILLKKEVATGNLLASMKLVNGGASSIESPITGIILTKHVLSNEFVDKAEALLTILPTNSKPYIEAKIPSSQAVKLTIGDTAIINLSNGKQMTAKIKSIKNIDTPNHPMLNLVNIVLDPKIHLSNKKLGDIVTVTIDTFK